MSEEPTEFPQATPTNHGHFEGPATRGDFEAAQKMDPRDIAQIIFQERQTRNELTRREADIYDDTTLVLKGPVFRREADHKLAAINPAERRRMRPNGAIIGSIDGKGLKLVNDKYGHEAGNKMLFNIGRLLESVAHEDDLVGRLAEGSDEFGIVLFFRDDIKKPEEVLEEINKRLLQRVKEAVSRHEIAGLKWKLVVYSPGNDIRTSLHLADPIPDSENLMEWPPKEILPSR
ncbi:MAG TPA: diguanylate cyclase [Candidatus Saccharimonadales bacterium]|nr:diguanylate cyclase [Candidatus Saccharimonadales bacterium]